MKKITIIVNENEAAKVEEAIKDNLYFSTYFGTLKKYELYVVEENLDELMREIQGSIDLRKKENVIAVSSLDFVVSSHLQRKEKKLISKEKSPVEELITSSLKYTKFDPHYFLLTSIAGIIALTGLFMNNIAVIIGAMLLSPLLGPIYTFALNIAVGRARDGLKSIGNLLLYISMVILLSYFITLLLSNFIPLSITQEILLRLDKNPIYLLIAFLLGFASVLSFSKGISESIAGIAIAAALLPPAAVTGISLALSPEIYLRPLILTLENVLGLMAGALFAFPVLKIGPRKYYEKEKAGKFMIRVALVISLLFLLLFFFAIM
ncbi:MAG: TIGR00341 family protein [Thermoplasmata archaeon]|nr:TIGR00341 family protein [Thermoplasmata archaeon]